MQGRTSEYVYSMLCFPTTPKFEVCNFPKTSDLPRTNILKALMAPGIYTDKKQTKQKNPRSF